MIKQYSNLKSLNEEDFPEIEKKEFPTIEPLVAPKIYQPNFPQLPEEEPSTENPEDKFKYFSKN